MLAWREFEKAQPDMAAFGLKRIGYEVMYIATIRKDGYPRVHPFTPFVIGGHLFAFMEPTSPKGKDLKRNGMYALHSLVTDKNGTNGEFAISGKAIEITDQNTRALAVRGSPFTATDRYVCFEFLVENCMTNEYKEGKPNLKNWKVAPAA